MKPRVVGSKRDGPSVVKKSLFLRGLGAAACLVIGLQVYLLLVGIGYNPGNQTPSSTAAIVAKGSSHRRDRETPTTLFSHPGTPQSKTTTTPKTNTTATATVAYAISLIKCSDKQTTDAGLIDAALVLRHSIHKISIRNFAHSGSQYDYRMYALVHQQAEPCSHVLRTAGFQVVLIDESPVQPHQIQGDYLRNNIETEWCCGSAEFIKLYAYTLPEPLVVHVDIDFVFLRPMDDLFDAILYPKDSAKGQRARSKIPRERPDETDESSSLPDTIDAFITRDWPQVIPGRKALYQAGFLVARRNPDVLQEAINIVKEGNFKEGYDLHNGWGGAGYGGFVGGKKRPLMCYVRQDNVYFWSAHSPGQLSSNSLNAAMAMQVSPSSFFEDGLATVIAFAHVLHSLLFLCFFFDNEGFDGLLL